MDDMHTWMDLTNDKLYVFLGGEWMINHRHSPHRMSFQGYKQKAKKIF